MAAPQQMTKHMLNPIGGWNQETSLMRIAPLSSNVTIDPLPAGRCVHVNTSGEFETGAPAAAKGIGHMPMFTFQSSDAYDVKNDGGIAGSESDPKYGWIANSPSGNLSAYVATAGMELETTEYNQAPSYAIGELLQSVKANTASTGGILIKGDKYAVPIVGVVSQGTGVSYDENVLRFYPVFIPEIADGITEPTWA